jgi:hypothetical protein
MHSKSRFYCIIIIAMKLFVFLLATCLTLASRADDNSTAWDSDYGTYEGAEDTQGYVYDEYSSDCYQCGDAMCCSDALKNSAGVLIVVATMAGFVFLW